jgi:hypothetical protein
MYNTSFILSTVSSLVFLVSLWSYLQNRRHAPGPAPASCIRHRARQHPKAAIGMHPVHSLGTERLDRHFDTPRHFVGCFDLVVLDVDDADAQSDARLEVAKDAQFVIATARKFEHQVIHLQRIEEGQQVTEKALLDRLPP